MHTAYVNRRTYSRIRKIVECLYECARVNKNKIHSHVFKHTHDQTNSFLEQLLLQV